MRRLLGGAVLAFALAGCAASSSVPSSTSLATVPATPSQPPATPTGFARFEEFTDRAIPFATRIAPMLSSISDGSPDVDRFLDELNGEIDWLDKHPPDACYRDAYDHWKLALSAFALGFAEFRAGESAGALHWFNEGTTWMDSITSDGVAASSACVGT